jgi:hypothetical protein
MMLEAERPVQPSAEKYDKFGSPCWLTRTLYASVGAVLYICRTASCSVFQGYDFPDPTPAGAARIIRP